MLVLHSLDLGNAMNGFSRSVSKMFGVAHEQGQLLTKIQTATELWWQCSHCFCCIITSTIVALVGLLVIVIVALVVVLLSLSSYLFLPPSFIGVLGLLLLLSFSNQKF